MKNDTKRHFLLLNETSDFEDKNNQTPLKSEEQHHLRQKNES